MLRLRWLGLSCRFAVGAPGTKLLLLSTLVLSIDFALSAPAAILDEAWGCGGLLFFKLRCFYEGLAAGAFIFCGLCLLAFCCVGRCLSRLGRLWLWVMSLLSPPGLLLVPAPFLLF